MAAIPVQDLVRDGVEPTFNAASGPGDEFQNDAKTLVYVKNGATDVNITFQAQNTLTSKPGFGDITLGNQVVTVPANEERAIGYFEAAIFNDINGRVQMSYDDVANVTIAVLKAPRIS